MKIQIVERKARFFQIFQKRKKIIIFKKNGLFFLELVRLKRIPPKTKAICIQVNLDEPL